ncbi:MAG: carboxylating nicotinate-nucleotide diphosphorylase, partial [Bdellovibrionales bacterium]
MTTAELIAEAYTEDVPNGDLTTDNLQLTERMGDARLVAKEDLVLSGREMFEACVLHMAPEAQLKWQFENGAFILAKQTVCWIKSDLLLLLKAERVALNFLGHLSGIATLTRCYVQETRDTDCKILDTRKTTPLLRSLEKQAVRDGGGMNHRRSLSEAVLIKENHIRASGGLGRAVRSIRAKYRGLLEVECSTLEEVAEAVNNRVDRILLDNMSNEMTKEAREIIPATIEIEASGNMNLSRIQSVAKLGVDFIS